MVFLAANEQTKEKVALKIFSSSEPASEVLDSIKRSSEFSHIGLVKIFDYGSLNGFNKESDAGESSSELEDCFYIAMEYVGKLSAPGSTFDSQKSLISKNFLDFISNSTQYLTENAIIDLLFQLLDILEYVHGVDGENSFGTAFGGIFPNNILIEELDLGKFKLRITEFGIAINPKTNPEIAAFISSEEIQGQPLDQRSDIYSLGAIAYALITGVPPQSPVAPPSQIRTDILPDWDKLIQQTLAYDSKDRLENYRKFRKEISMFNKHVTKPWIRPMNSGLLTAVSIIGIIVIGYFGYKIFENNRSTIKNFTKKTVAKTSDILKSKELTEKPKLNPLPTNLLETSELSVAGRKTEDGERKTVDGGQNVAQASRLEKVEEQKTEDDGQNVAQARDRRMSGSRLEKVEGQKTEKKVQSTKIQVQSTKLSKYTVQKGDTLWSISQKHKLSTTELLKINNLPTNTIIKVGQILNLVADAKPVAEPKENKSYEVQKGDTYYSLSRKFNCDVKKLQELNQNQALQTGQKIIIP